MLDDFSSYRLRQQLAIDDVGRRHLAIPFKNSDVLVRGTTAVGVVRGIARDRFAIAGSEMVNLAHQLP
jgi:hypothetical protein